MIQAGSLNRRISIEAPPTGKDENGDLNVAWTPFCKAWAKKEDLSGRELFAAQAAQSEVTTRFRIRFRPDVTDLMRVVCGGIPFNIEAVLDRDGCKEELQLMCSSGLTNG